MVSCDDVIRRTLVWKTEVLTITQRPRPRGPLNHPRLEVKKYVSSFSSIQTKTGIWGGSRTSKYWRIADFRCERGVSVQLKNKRTFKVKILCGCSEGFRKAARQRQTDWQTAASSLSCIIDKSALWDEVMLALQNRPTYRQPNFRIVNHGRLVFGINFWCLSQFSSNVLFREFTAATWSCVRPKESDGAGMAGVQGDYIGFCAYCRYGNVYRMACAVINQRCTFVDPGWRVCECGISSQVFSDSGWQIA